MAWQRVKIDEVVGRTLVSRPFEIELIDVDAKGWLDSLVNQIRRGRYTPEKMTVCNVPKRNGSSRPAVLLTMADRVVYAACAGACFLAIQRALRWTGDTLDFAFRLSEDENDPQWLPHPFTWYDFQDHTRSMIRAGASHILTLDVAGYYDNIDLDVLLGDLRGAEAPDLAIDQLGGCLRRWSLSPGRGIPQGHSASDVLGKLYLGPVDRQLRSLGYAHCRLLDEFRIFCRSRSEAKQAERDLTRILNERGLKPQPSKSAVYRAGISKWHLSMTLSVVFKRFQREIPRALRIALARFWLVMNARFDYTRHCHGILEMLKALQDPAAVEYCRMLLKKYPQRDDTLDILTYCESVDAVAEVGRTVDDWLQSGEAIPVHQLYQVIGWLSGRNRTLSDTVMARIRSAAFDGALPDYLRALARKFLGRHGSADDLKRLARSYAEATDEWEQAEILCCLQRLDGAEREALLRRAEPCGEWTRRAVSFLRNGAPPAP